MFRDTILPMSQQDMRICVDKFRQKFLPHIPFLHSLTCEQECLSKNSALYYTMAMVGSFYLDECRSNAAKMYELAIGTLQKQSPTGNARLQHLQAKVLLLDFAVWYGSEETRKWASTETQSLGTSLVELMSAELPPMSYEDWGKWRLREEIKRTIFAFFINSVMQSTFYSHYTPTLASSIELSLPCPESVWETTTEAQWHAQIELLRLREKSEIIFPNAAYAILSQDTVFSTDYEQATVFGQLILLCVIMNSYNVAAELPANYTNAKGWKSRDMSAFRLREGIDGALGLWSELWFASPECLWDSNIPAHPRIENIFLHQYITIKLHRNDSSSHDRPEWTYKAIECATSVFCSVSRAGFSEVATYSLHILNFYCYFIAVEMARTMMAWLNMIALPSYGPLPRRDARIITRLRQAVRRHHAHPPSAIIEQQSALGFAPVPMPEPLRNGASLEELIRLTEEIWTVVLGGEQWKEDRVNGFAVEPPNFTPLPHVNSSISLP